MRTLITGVDDQGCSFAVSEKPLILGADPAASIDVTTVSATQTCPPGPTPRGRASVVDMGLSPGIVRWVIIDFKPEATGSYHHTNSVDFGIILDGTVDLVLDDGNHPLGPGDCVVLNGVDHAWRAGPSGCRMSAVSIGTPPSP